MKHSRGFLLACLLLVSPTLSRHTQAQEAELVAPRGAGNLSTLRDKASYGIGRSIGRNLRAQGLDVDPRILAQGIADALTGAKPPLPDAELQQALGQFQRLMESKLAQRQQQLGEQNKKQGEAFLAANKVKPGVVTLPSGLQYKVLSSGNGATPSKTDTVKTHYHGTLTDGTVFDSSVERGEPISFPVNGVIPGWTEALQRMKVGDKWQLFIPSELAYGARGAGADIGPHAVLVFEIELLGIE